MNTVAAAAAAADVAAVRNRSASGRDWMLDAPGAGAESTKRTPEAADEGLPMDDPRSRDRWGWPDGAIAEDAEGAADAADERTEPADEGL